MVIDEVPLELVKCGMCGKAIVVEQGERHICSMCVDEEHRLYTSVRALLRDYERSGLSIRDVAEILKVDEYKVTHLVESGYFVLALRGLRPND
ncbi:MAG: hypothetical protein LBU13_03590 [Synergistaceae bacterium]|jgi:hypothetical protein|nr:hypothetical protein [Synergistaceae bacterium]